MAMLISLSHRDEREITVLPPNPIWAFGVNRKTRLDLFHSEAVEHRSHAGRQQTLVGLEEMRVGHRRNEVADDPKVAASNFVLCELFAWQQPSGIGLHRLEDGDHHSLALELEVLDGRLSLVERGREGETKVN